MKFKLFCCAFLSTIIASTAISAPAFYEASKACKIEILDHSFPVQFGVGDYEVDLKIKNIGDAALRGVFVIESTDAKGGNMRLHTSRVIDLPPPSVSDVEFDLKLEGKFLADEVKRIVKVLLKTSAGDVVCYEGTVAEKAVAAPKRGTEKKSAGPVFARNYDVKFADSLPEGEGAKWRKFIENGGILIVSNISSNRDFAGAAEFCEKKYLPSYWQQRMPLSPRDRSVTPGGSPCLDWPHRISETMQAVCGRFHLSGNSQTKGSSTFWECVQHPTSTVMMRIGNGVLMLSTLNLVDSPVLRENIITNLKLYADGYRFGYFSYEFGNEEKGLADVNNLTTAGGRVSVRVYNIETEPARKIDLAFRLTLTALDGSRRSRTFVSRRRQSSKPGDWLDLRIGIPALPANFEGEWNAKAELYEWGGEKIWVIDERKIVFSDMIEIVPPDYRSTVSTERREADVTIGIKANRVNLDMGGMKWKMSAKDASGKVIANAAGVFETGERFTEAKLPVARNAPAGKYLLEAEVETPCGGVKNLKSEFFIVAPEKGQIIVDQNGFFLNEGKPYFPLGVYHVTAEEWNKPIDESGLKPADMGFNWRQMWGDEWKRSYSLDRADVAEFVNAKLTEAEREKVIDGMLVTNKANRAALKDVAVCLEAFDLWNIVYFEKPGETGRYSYELDPDVAAKIKEISADDAQLVRMWHLANRSKDDLYRGLRYTANWIRKHDSKFHPVLNLGELSAIMAGDIGGDRFSMRYRGEVGDARVFAETIAEMSENLARYHRRPFVVPQAYGTKGQSTETPEWVRAQAYLAIINGANGLGFYCWRETGGHERNAQGMGWHPQTAHAVKRIIGEVKEFQAALFAPDRKIIVSDDGNILALLCGDEKSGRYLIAASTLELPIETELPVPGLADMELEPLFGAPEAVRPGGFLGFGKRESLVLSLPALGTAVWRVK